MWDHNPTLRAHVLREVVAVDGVVVDAPGLLAPQAATIAEQHGETPRAVGWSGSLFSAVRPELGCAMDLTHSFLNRIPADIADRYQFAETRNATAIFAATNPAAFEQLLDVLRRFELKTTDLITPGGQESDLAARVNRAFRDHGWREARVDTLIRLSLQRTPLAAAGETMLEPIVTETRNEGYKVDNFRDRVALDMEWNAKDGNLDRDISAYRALYEASLIDVGVLVTRTLDLRDLGRQLGVAAGMPISDARRILNTTTTTNREKLLPRLTRGDAGGCPILAVFICPATHIPD